MLKKVALTALLISVFSQWALPCNVPVFRYALERWRSDSYDACVFYRPPLASADSSLAQQMADAANPPTSANVRVLLVNVADSLEQWLRDAWAAQKQSATPWVVLFTPPSEGHKAVWSGGLTAANVKAIVSSPLRREVFNRITRGESAVWIVVQGNDRARDREVSDMLMPALKNASDSLKLPNVEDGGAGSMSEFVNVSQKIPLRVKFSALYLSRTDPSEQVFLSMLMGTKNVSKDSGGTALCVMFGRGRNLDVLRGKQISASGIRQMCQFLIGFCSCTIKEANPGTDMLMAGDWDGALSGSSAIQETMPELRGMTTIGDPVAPPDTSHSAAPAKQPAKKGTEAKKK
jgi:hypothetical protein